LPLHAPLLHEPPTQQRWPLPPHGSHVPAPVQRKPKPQKPVPPRAGQQGCPLPPQATHWPLSSVAKGAVQPASPQRACPTLPHAPFMQPPPVQVPCMFEHMPPEATQVCVL
jgi:hypothetical protein